MSAVDVSRLKLGDKVLVYSPQRLGGGSTGWYIVIQVGAAAAAVIRAEVLDVSQRLKVFDGDIVEVLRPAAVDIAMLPAASGMDLDTPLPETIAAPPPVPEVKPEPLVTISVPDPARKAYQFPSRGVPEPPIILPEDSPHLNRNRISKKIIKVPASLVGIVLAGVDGSHLIGGVPASLEDPATVER